MPKRRDPASPAKNLTVEQVEAFASGATSEPEKPDPSAPRDFKAIRVGLNKHEYQILEAASLKAGRSKLNFIRYAILKMAEEMEP